MRTPGRRRAHRATVSCWSGANPVRSSCAPSRPGACSRAQSAPGPHASQVASPDDTRACRVAAPSGVHAARRVSVGVRRMVGSQRPICRGASDRCTSSGSGRRKVRVVDTPGRYVLGGSPQPPRGEVATPRRQRPGKARARQAQQQADGPQDQAAAPDEVGELVGQAQPVESRGVRGPTPSRVRRRSGPGAGTGHRRCRRTRPGRTCRPTRVSAPYPMRRVRGTRTPRRTAAASRPAAPSPWPPSRCRAAGRPARGRPRGSPGRSTRAGARARPVRRR